MEGGGGRLVLLDGAMGVAIGWGEGLQFTEEMD
jgi:hypothetical protein